MAERMKSTGSPVHATWWTPQTSCQTVFMDAVLDRRGGQVPYGPFFFRAEGRDRFLAGPGASLPFSLERLWATAARTSPFKAGSSILSPSWKSIARHLFPPSSELNNLLGSGRLAPSG